MTSLRRFAALDRPAARDGDTASGGRVVGEFARRHDSPPAFARDPAGDPLGATAVAAMHGVGRTVPRRRVRDRLTDADAASRDQDPLAVALEVHPVSPTRTATAWVHGV